MDRDELMGALVGRSIVDVSVVGNHPALTLEDGTVVTFEGLGYDGLWTEVVTRVERGDAAQPTEQAEPQPSRDELGEAMERLSARKIAAGVAEDRQTEDQLTSHERSRMIYAGLDLDYDRLVEYGWIYAGEGCESVLKGASPAAVCQGLWIDGVATGVLLGQARVERGEGGG